VALSGLFANAAPYAARGPRLSSRRARNRITWVLCGLALALVVIPVVSIVANTASQALSHFHWSVLTTYPVGNGGGLLNSIEGTLTLVLGVLILAGTVGIAGGVYLAEYAGEGATFLRGASEVLSGVPSIVVGYVGYVALVVAFHWGNSIVAGVIALSVIVIPYIVKTTEVALRTVPTTYREGGEALGMRPGYVLRKLVLRPALPGVATGLILAVAISIGETAPLLYTAGYSQNPPTLALHRSPVGYLTYNVFTDYNQPSTYLHHRAAVAALLLIVLVVVLIVAARVVVMVTQRHAPDRPQRLGRAKR
jgi:phosphate transport system permease protein